MGRNPVFPFSQLSYSQPPHHLLHPFLPDVGVHRGGGDALVAERGLDVHPFGSGVAPVGGGQAPASSEKSAPKHSAIRDVAGRGYPPNRSAKAR